jgi:hypothetical protein
LGSALGNHQLRPHPKTPPSTVTGIVVHLALDRPRELQLEYRVSGSGLALPEELSRRRSDGLWKSTCFELFARSIGSERYCEFNFSPSGEWAAYSFSGYREGMAALDIAPPLIGRTVNGRGLAIGVRVALPLQPPLRVGLSAVIEETSGRISYWALAHPAAKPDFHHPDSFVHEI